MEHIIFPLLPASDPEIPKQRPQCQGVFSGISLMSSDMVNSGALPFTSITSTATVHFPERPPSEASIYMVRSNFLKIQLFFLIEYPL